MGRQGTMGGARTRGGWVLVAALAGFLAFATAALAKHAGELDHSFGDKGFTFSHPAGDIGRSFAVAVGKKDKPVVAGDSRNGFGVVRYTRHGQVDSSFGRDGVKTNFGPPFASAKAVDVGRKGVVVAAGVACHRDDGCNLALAKYQSDGQRDKSFGDNGRVELTFGPGDSTANAIAFVGHGKILVAGSRCITFDDCDFVLARLLPNGAPDPSFGVAGNGKVVTPFQDEAGHPINADARAMAIDSGGGIAVGGYSSKRVGVLSRYDQSGRLLSSFGRDGKVVTNNMRHLGPIAGLAADAKDKIVAVGVDKKNLGGRWALARFGKGGGVDSSFGKDGSVVTGFKGHQGVYANGLAIDSKNRIVVTGFPGVSMARYQPNGKLNRSFGHDGRTTVGKKRHVDADALAIDSHDRPIVSGDVARFFVVGRLLG